MANTAIALALELLPVILAYLQKADPKDLTDAQRDAIRNQSDVLNDEWARLAPSE